MVSPENNTTHNSAEDSAKNGAEHSAEHGAENRTPKGTSTSRRDGRRTTAPAGGDERSLDSPARYAFPDQEITQAEIRELLANGSRKQRAQMITNLVCFVSWHELWTLVSTEEVREIFPHLTLSPALEKAWASWLKLPEG